MSRVISPIDSKMATVGVGELSTSYWINFFTSAGIPAGDAANYAVIFVDNRITKGMFLDLTKEYLNDMGVTRLGDIIAILKHAKQVHNQDVRDKALHGFQPIPTTTPTPAVRRSTVASRMIDHHVHKERDPPLSNTPLAQKLAALEAAKKSSVFSRLGADSPTTPAPTKKASVGSTTPSSQSSVFSRLGDKTVGKAVKRPASSTSLEAPDSPTEGRPLEYAGILKAGANKTPRVSSTTGPPAKVARRTSHPNLVITRTLSAPAPKKVPSSDPPVQTAGILSDYAKQDSTSIKDRLGKKVVTAAATSTTGPGTTPGKVGSPAAPNLTVRATTSNRPGAVTVRTSTIAGSRGIKARLGPKPAVSSSSESKPGTQSLRSKQQPASTQQGVFSRLGKKVV